MKRLEVFANLSVQEEILHSLDEVLPDFCYTLLPVVQGKGRQDYKLGTLTWPEKNFMLISYLKDEEATKALQELTKIKQNFPHEGVCFFTVDACDSS